MAEWSRYEDQFLTKNWPTHTATQIGEALSRSKGSIIGRAGRLGLAKKGNRNHQKVVDVPKVIKSSPKPRPQPEKAPDRTKGCTLMHLVPQQCRAIISGSGENAVFCPKQKKAGSSYCAGHHEQFHTPARVLA